MITERFSCPVRKDRERGSHDADEHFDKIDPEIEKNGTLASPATAFASNVLPVPEVPHQDAFGIYRRALEFLGSLRNSMISESSSFGSSTTGDVFERDAFC